MPIYTYECDVCAERHEMQRAIDERAIPFGCAECRRGRMRLVPSLPAPPRGSFDSPRSSAYRMQKYVGERLEGKRLGPHGEAVRRLGFEPRPASDSGVTDDRLRG